MPPSSVNDLDDAALARLLTEEARASSAKYASGTAPRRANGNVLKPNTRFLKNLVRDADTHNAALKRKEDSERTERLRQIEEDERRREREEGRERKRRRTEDGEDGRSKRRKHDKRRERDEHQSRKHRRNTSSEGSRSGSPARRSEKESHHHHSRQRRDSRPKSSRADKDNDSKPTSHRKHKRRRSPSPTPPPRSTHKNGTTRRRTPMPTQSPSPTPSSPLPHLLGSLAPPLRRQLGPSHKSSAYHNPSNSAMDARFSSHYDPTTDVKQIPDDEDGGDDWDMALEALRDRRSYAKKQGERMREAGFDEETISKWEGSGEQKEKGWEDVRWKRKGEEREWDVGKVDLDDDAVAEAEVEKVNGRRRKVVDGQDAWKRKGGGLLKGLRDALG